MWFPEIGQAASFICSKLNQPCRLNKRIFRKEPFHEPYCADHRTTAGLHNLRES
jgi:hypothetical protein